MTRHAHDPTITSKTPFERLTGLAEHEVPDHQGDTPPEPERRPERSDPRHQSRGE